VDLAARKTVERRVTRNEPDSQGPLTLAFDIGGSHLKAGILSPNGKLLKGPSQVVTPHPTVPQEAVEALVGLAHGLGPHDRITIGFPGVVRDDYVVTAPNLGTELWQGFKLAAVMHETLKRPVRMLNDASVQGLGAITGRGLELAITLGTGFGFALFEHGRLAPHLEFGQIPIKTGVIYDHYLGTRALEAVGPKEWNARLREVIGVLTTFTNYDMLFIGGGNARLIEKPLPDTVRTVSNEDGITGGVKVWDKAMDASFTGVSSAFVTVA
jgi:polyphosphate glucokinase